MNWSTRATLLAEYFMICAAAGLALHVLSLATGEPTVLWILGGLTAVGMALSGLSRIILPRWRFWRDGAAYFDMAVGGLAFWTADVMTQAVLPVEDLGSDLDIALRLGWIMAARSAFLASDGALLFQLVPAIAIFGLTATSFGAAEPMAAFGGYLGCAIYVLVSQHRRTREREAVANIVSFHRGNLRLALYALSTSMLLGIAFTPIAQRMMHMFGEKMRVPSLGTSPVGRNQEVPNSVQVGTGPVNPTEQEVMHIRSPKPFYWRARVYDEYTGHGWGNTTGRGAKKLLDSYTLDLVGTRQWAVPQLDEDGPITKTVQIRVTYRTPLGTAIYAPSTTAAVRGELSQLSADSANCLTTESNNPTGTAYFLDVGMTEINPTKLRRIVTSRAPDEKALQCWFDPNTVGAYALNRAAERLRFTAQAITANAANQYDKVVALREYIAKRCTYNTQAQAFSKDVDVTDYFLNTQRVGYCDAFATSLAILCRHIGIPARTAIGFSPGEYDAERGEFIVRDANRHMWTEVFFEGVGWVAFEATEGAPQSSIGALGAPTTLWQRILSRVQMTLDTWWGKLVALILVVMAALFAGRRVNGRWKLLFGRKGACSLLNTCFDQLCADLSRSGNPPRRPSQTLLEYTSAASATMSSSDAAFAIDLAARYNQLCFGRKHPAPGDILRFAAHVRGFRSHLRKNTNQAIHAGKPGRKKRGQR